MTDRQEVTAGFTEIRPVHCFSKHLVLTWTVVLIPATCSIWHTPPLSLVIGAPKIITASDQEFKYDLLSRPPRHLALYCDK